ncbi:MAG: hypothetical protein JWN30_779 [Bacilli bacterium]|nr:hypothetical protein [Bacilli bacterium]
MRRSISALVAVAAILAVTTVIENRPHSAQLNQPKNNAAALNSQAQTASTRLVAQDVAQTASLCVSDCQTTLQHVVSSVAHETSLSGKQQVIENALRTHPQFQTMRLQLPGSGLQTFGKQPSTECSTHLAAVENSAKQERKLSYGNLETPVSDGAPTYHLALAAPISFADPKQQQSGAGVLSADTSMEILGRVAKHLDRQFGTATSLSHTGKTIHLGEPLALEESNQPNATVASAQVPAAGWTVSSHSKMTAKANRTPIDGNTELVVRFRTKQSDEQLHQMEAASKSTVTIKRHASRIYVFQAPGDRIADLTSFFFSAGALSIEPHTKARIHQDQTTTNEPNDVLYGRYQWNFPYIGADQEWSINTGNPAVKVAVVDTGVDMNHPEFQDQLTDGYNVIDPSSPAQDDNGHGTHVSGVIAAKTNNLEGVAGIAFNNKIMPVKAMDKDGSGSVADIATGIEWAVDHGANVINLSLGNNEDSAVLHQAVQYAYSHNVAVIAAMGNDNSNEPNYPAAYPEAISVCALDSNGQRASFSNYGPHAFISAPGVSIASTYPDNRYASMSGTSMACPHITGVVSLLKSINAQFNVDQIKSILQNSAIDLGDPGRDPYYGYGLVNAPAAASQAAGQAPASPTP